MKVRLTVPVVVLGLLAASAPADANPACVRWWTQTLSGIGFTHVVGIENTCDRPAACVISTDVAPDPVQSTVPPRQKVELVTYRGSPSPTFKAKVECKLQ